MDCLRQRDCQSKFKKTPVGHHRQSGRYSSVCRDAGAPWHVLATLYSVLARHHPWPSLYEEEEHGFGTSDLPQFHRGPGLPLPGTFRFRFLVGFVEFQVRLFGLGVLLEDVFCDWLDDVPLLGDHLRAGHFMNGLLRVPRFPHRSANAALEMFPVVERIRKFVYLQEIKKIK